MLTENHTVHGKPTGLCLSWFTGKVNAQTYFTYAGSGGGYYEEMRLYPDVGKGSVLFFNRTGLTDERVLARVDRYVFI